MSTNDHPNNAPGVPMPVPPALESFQVNCFNPLIAPLAKKLPGCAVVKQHGRKTP